MRSAITPKEFLVQIHLPLDSSLWVWTSRSLQRGGAFAFNQRANVCIKLGKQNEGTCINNNLCISFSFFADTCSLVLIFLQLVKSKSAKFKSGYLPGGLLKVKHPMEVLWRNLRKLFSFLPFQEGCCYSVSNINLAWRKITKTLGSKNSQETLGS